MADKHANTPPNLGRDRLFAQNILRCGTLEALKEAGAALLKFDSTQRLDLFDELHYETDRLYKQLMFEALSEIEADIAIERVRAATKGTLSAPR